MQTIYAYYFVFDNNASKSIANIKGSQSQKFLKRERLRGLKNNIFRTAFKVYFYMILIMIFFLCVEKKFLSHFVK